VGGTSKEIWLAGLVFHSFCARNLSEKDVRPRHVNPPSAKPARVVLALFDPFQVHSRPLVVGACLSSTTGNAVPSPIEAGLFK
jgi:hypothetical protein